MIKKLRMRFVLAAMLSLFAVFFILGGSISVLAYKNVSDNADATLSILKENDGVFPKDSYKKKDKPSEAEDEPSREDTEPRALSSSPEKPYETRYFSVFLSADCEELVSVNTDKIAAIDDDSAVEMAQAVLKSGKETGFSKSYRYIVYSSGDEVHLIFLDCSRDMRSLLEFLVIGVGVSIAGMAIIFLLLFLFSGRVVKPFEQNYKNQKQFITDAGHELKTPLTIIEADAEVLEMDVGESEWLDDIKTQTKRLADLTNTLIFLAKSEEGQPQEKAVDFPVSEVVEDTVETFQALAKTNNKRLGGEIEPMLTMHGDENAFRRLVTILLDNAVKYSDSGGRIEVRLSGQEKQLKLEVFNTAEHVAKESTEHLFDRFYRADESRNSQTGGYGLGLSIAQAITRVHRGSIAAFTEDEKSLLITATFPMA